MGRMIVEDVLSVQEDSSVPPLQSDRQKARVGLDFIGAAYQVSFRV
jgi:hypothetical protein